MDLVDTIAQVNHQINHQVNQVLARVKVPRSLVLATLVRTMRMMMKKTLQIFGAIKNSKTTSMKTINIGFLKWKIYSTIIFLSILRSK